MTKEFLELQERIRREVSELPDQLDFSDFDEEARKIKKEVSELPRELDFIGELDLPDELPFEGMEEEEYVKTPQPQEYKEKVEKHRRFW